MGSSGTMVTDMAEVLDLPAVTLATYVKVLRAGRLIQSSGRGTSAAKMSTPDFAALIIAALAQPPIAHCLERTLELQRLPFAKRLISVKNKNFAGGATDVSEIVTAHSPLEPPPQDFGGAVQMLLQAVQGQFGRSAAWHPLHTRGASFSIAFTSPGDFAIVEQTVHDSYRVRYVFTAENVSRFDETTSIYEWQTNRTKSTVFNVRTFGDAVLQAAVVSMCKPIRRTRAHSGAVRTKSQPEA